MLKNAITNNLLLKLELTGEKEKGYKICNPLSFKVGVDGFEPPTLCL